MGKPVIFEVQTPVSDAGLRENVRASLARGLPEARNISYPKQDALNIIANGPTARAAPIENALHTLALNGALSLFGEVGPTYWAGCDPQAELADFLTNPPLDTAYLVASKCHPRVFDTLLDRGCTVRIWHVWEPCVADLLGDRITVAPGCSITTTAFELGVHLGYTSFDVWGWDGCFDANGACHAGQHFPSASPPVTILLDDREFASTQSWALELEDARVRLLGFPFPIRVHGGGLFGAGLAALLPNRVTED